MKGGRDANAYDQTHAGDYSTYVGRVQQRKGQVETGEQRLRIRVTRMGVRRVTRGYASAGIGGIVVKHRWNL